MIKTAEMKILLLAIALAFLNISALAGISFEAYVQNNNFQDMNRKFSSIESSVSKFQEENISKEQFDALVERSKSNQQQIEGLLATIATLQNKTLDSVKREISQQKSQDQILMEAVAKITPSVVSIVITKDVPRLEVVYLNPFGDDPFFNDVDLRVPRYIQKGTEEKRVGAGTGFLISGNGYIVTNRHVVDDPKARYTALLSDGVQKPATISYIDDKVDLAIVKVDGTNYPHVDMGNSDVLKLGQTVFAVGNALGEYNNSVSTGIISGLDRTVTASDSSGQTETLSGVIQTDTPINPGNSGGPLVTLDGDVIGVNVATVVGSNNISFAIPINMIKSTINSYAK